MGEREEILLNYATEKSMETAEIPLEEVTETKIPNFKFGAVNMICVHVYIYIYIYEWH